MPGFFIYEVLKETYSRLKEGNFWLFHANNDGTSCIICGIVSLLSLLNIRLTEKQEQ